MFGVFKENPFHFKHNGLESMIITIGNKHSFAWTLILQMVNTWKPTTPS